MIYHFFQYFCGIIYYQTAMQRIIFLFLSALLIISCGKKEVPAEEELVIPECKVTAVPDSLGYDKFYTKYVDVNGLPLVSSWRVPDSAFVAAHRTLYAMTSMLRPEILQTMIKSKARVAIMGPLKSANSGLMRESVSKRASDSSGFILDST